MNVAELITLLQDQDPEAKVSVTTTCHGCYGDKLSVGVDDRDGEVFIEGDR